MENIKKENNVVFRTGSGIPVDRIYEPEKTDNNEYLTKIGSPGTFPYTRGIYQDMYRKRKWTIRQYAGFGSAEEANIHFLYLLEKGQNGLSVAFDLPTQLGYDSDNELSKGEVGRVGVAIDSLEDMQILFTGIPLERVSVSMTINAPALILFAMLLIIAKKQGVAKEFLRGTIQNDILKEYIARGTYIFPPKPSLKLAIDLIEYCASECPLIHPISISGYHIREAGSTAPQELAFTFSNAITYLEHITQRNLKIDDFASRISFFFSAHNDFFEEIAKFRAARRIWAKILRNRFTALHPESMMLRFHTQTAGCTLSAQQPENNIIRVSLQALAAVLGGTQSLHTNGYDEAYGLPSTESVTTALRTQQILAYESGVINTVDPLGGSFYLETLTDKIEQECFKAIDQIERMGGMLNAISAGFIQAQIHKSAYIYQQELIEHKRIQIGVNEFIDDSNMSINMHDFSDNFEQKQLDRLMHFKNTRNNQKVRDSLANLKKNAMNKENLMPAVIYCVESCCTVGEICLSLRDIFGEHKESTNWI